MKVTHRPRLYFCTCATRKSQN